MKLRRITRAIKVLSRIFEIVNISKNSQNFQQFFSFSKIFTLKIKIFKKKRTTWYRLMADEYVYTISSRYLQKMAEICHKTCRKQALYTSFRDLTVISRILFFDRFWRFKSVIESFFAFFAKIWPKNMYCSCKSRNCFVWPFYLVTWDDLDLYYGHKAQEMLLKNVSDTIHADSLALFALSSKFYSIRNFTPSPKCQTFWLWPDLWCPWWPRDQWNLFSFDSFSMDFECRLNF